MPHRDSFTSIEEAARRPAIEPRPANSENPFANTQVPAVSIRFSQSSRSDRLGSNLGFYIKP